jgi:hypothetical protein
MELIADAVDYIMTREILSNLLQDTWYLLLFLCFNIPLFQRLCTVYSVRKTVTSQIMLISVTTVGSEVLTAEVMKSSIFWDIMLCTCYIRKDELFNVTVGFHRELWFLLPILIQRIAAYS